MQLKTRAATVGGAAVVALGLMIVARPAITAVFSSPMRDVDNAARQPVQVYNQLDLDSGSINESASAQYVVPAGQRLVIDGVSADVVAPTGERVRVAVDCATAGMPFYAYPPLQWSANYSGLDEGYGTVAVPLYCDPGNQVDVRLSRIGPSVSGPISGLIYWSGHLVSLP